MGSIHPTVSEICVPQSLDPICAKFDKFLAHGQAHMGQMGKWPWQCTTTGLDNSTELRMEKIHQEVTEIWVPQVWQPPARPPARTVTTIPLQPGGLRGKKVPHASYTHEETETTYICSCCIVQKKDLLWKQTNSKFLKHMSQRVSVDNVTEKDSSDRQQSKSLHKHLPEDLYSQIHWLKFYWLKIFPTDRRVRLLMSSSISVIPVMLYALARDRVCNPLTHDRVCFFDISINLLWRLCM